MVVRKILGQTLGVLLRLGFDAGEWVSLGLGFNDSDGLGIGVEHVVGIASGEWELPNGNAQPRRDVHLAVVLHDPASLLKLPVDLLPSFLFGGHDSP